ncbi:MAG: hypothetical protein IT423_05395, partial [Pirellulaceae bacterium]|nr:hypothetical protein [Pirellulaceae bacterium]
MADWRDGSDPKPSRRNKPEKPAALPNPGPQSADQNVPPTSRSPAHADKGWRSKSPAPGTRASSSASQAAQRDWMRTENAPVVIHGVRRRVFLVLATIAISLGIIWYIRHIFQSQPLLPLLVAIPTQYDAPELSENPYSAKAPELFRATNSRNIQLLKDPTAVPLMLDNILAGDDWQKKYFDQGIVFRNEKIAGGGPQSNLVAFFLSGYSVTRRQGDTTQLQLVSMGGQPFHMHDASNSGVDIETVLSRIISAVDSRATVWITLDVRPAPIIVNFGDLRQPLEESVQRWFKKLDQGDQNRTIITLPGTDIQENWYAPELGSSVLAHFYRRSLAGINDD